MKAVPRPPYLLIVVITLAATTVMTGIGLSAYGAYRESGRGELPPSHLLIGGERWFVESDPTLDKLTNRAGETLCAANTIYYDSNLTASFLRETLWHEIYHAELCKKHLKVYDGLIVFAPSSPYAQPMWQKAVDGEEHDVIYPLAMAQASFMHDNPEFVRWATQW